MGDMQYRLFSNAGHGDGGALDALASRDADIARVLAAYGPPPDRSLPANFDTLARAVIGQQVSRAAAGSIHNRMLSAGMTTADSVIRLSIDDLMQVGLSRRKAEYLIGIADEIVSGRLNMKQLAAMPGEEVQARLVAIRGIGAWTADNFRLLRLPIWMPGRPTMWRYRRLCGGCGRSRSARAPPRWRQWAKAGVPIGAPALLFSGTSMVSR